MAALAKIRHVALDMDGTIYVGSILFPYTNRFLANLRENGVNYSFLTNNPTKSVNDYLKKLESLGVKASREEMSTSAVSTIEYLRLHHPEVRRLFILGTPSMIAEFEEAGFESVPDDPDERPDMLLVSFDMTLIYSRFCRAAWWASQGVPYMATNPDKVCPTEFPTVLVDCGALCAAIEQATGRKPDMVIGKPNPGMLNVLMERRGLRPEELALCGDRIYTDVKAAQNAGAFSVLVLSGESTLETGLAANPQPDLIAENIEAFGELLVESRKAEAQKVE